MIDPGIIAARPRAGGEGGGASPAWRRPMSLLRMWIKRHRDRRVLDRLSAHQLRDVGLDPLEVRREAAKPFWMR